MERRSFLVRLAACAAPVAVHRHEGRGGSVLPPPRAGAVDSVVETARRERAIPGLSVVVARGDKTLLAKGYGYADAERKIPAAPETVYQIGSISKQFTAAAVMRLVERGRVSLNEPLTLYLPEYPAHGRSILIRHLLHQTSGLREPFTLAGFEELESGAPEKYSRSDLINLFKNEPLQFAPGERWAYSNANYTLLGVLVEKASGRTYDQYLQENFFRPLALRTIHSCRTRPAGERFATGYVPKGEGVVVAPPVNMNTAVGDGGLCASALDLVKWTRALVAGRAVAKSSYNQMTASATVQRGYRPDYGYGLSLVPLDGRWRRIGHNGEITGFTSALAHYPDEDLTIAVLTNRSQIWPETIEKAIARAVLGISPPVIRDLPVGDEDRRRYVGTYDFGVFPLLVTEEGGQLKYDMKMGRPPYALMYQGEHAFVARREPDAIRLTFSMRGGRADKLMIEMAAMRWYAERVA